MTGLHDEICLTRVGKPCNCPAAAWNAEAMKVWHQEARGYRGESLSKMSRRADLRRLWMRFRAWVLSFFPTYCMGCNREVDLTTCGCGSPINHSPWEGHTPRPMGCDCGRVK
jgi:hypothetical protein